MEGSLSIYMFTVEKMHEHVFYVNGFRCKHDVCTHTVFSFRRADVKILMLSGMAGFCNVIMLRFYFWKGYYES